MQGVHRPYALGVAGLEEIDFEREKARLVMLCALHPFLDELDRWQCILGSNL